MELSIIIINWNTRDLLEQCLDSLFRSTGIQELEVFVVDNASRDYSPEMVKERFPQVHLIANDTNIGFAAANNQAARLSTGEYILLLNSDTIVRSGAIDTLAQFLDNHQRVGAVGARLLNADSSLQYSCSPLPGLGREFKRMFHLPGVRQDGYYEMADWDINTSRQVGVLLGACMLIRRKALDQVGLLDEDYFMYTEEVDLCYRIARAGWQLFWVPAAEVVHFGGQSTRQASDEMFLRLYESKLLYFRKHHGRFKSLIYKLILMAASLLRLSLTPFAWLESPAKRQVHLVQAANYQRLLVSLPGM